MAFTIRQVFNLKSEKPRKQRKFLHEAPLHKRRKIIAAHLSKDLIRQYKRRSLPLKKGDEVKIVRGKERGKVGKISRIDSKYYQVFLEGVTRKRTVGTAAQTAFHPSNLLIVNPDLTDEKRRKILLRKVKEIKIPEKKEEPKKETKKSEEKTEVKHETEKATGAAVLESGEEGKKVGSHTKTGTAQKV